MYRLLIVDDEPDIVEGLYNAFYHYDKLELDIFKACSAFDALEILNTERIDILLSDINMPGMDGLEMTRLVKERWPHCQVIFLSGYTEFEYIYRANQLDAVNYILKIEGYEKIAEGLHNAVKRIQNQVQSHMNVFPPEFRHEIMASILEDSIVSRGELGEILQNMGLPLDPEQPVFLMTGRFFGTEGLNLKEQSEVYSLMGRLSETYILPQYHLLMDEYEKESPLFLLQHRMDAPSFGGDYPAPGAQIKGIAEIIQTRLSEESVVNLSIVIWKEPLHFHEVGDCYKVCRRLLNREASGAGLLAADTDTIASLETTPYSIAENQAISIVKDYICSHIEEQFSLTHLADLVYYNASYLSRIFKKHTGLTLTSYVTGMKIERAKKLLTDTNQKINSIAEDLGFASPSYFHQTFRKNMGVSPLEYRKKK